MSKLTNKQLKQFVESSYKKKKDAQTVDNYKLDNELSTRRNKVYHDDTSGKTIHAVAGTDRLSDWFNNAAIPLGVHNQTKRYKRAESIHKEANTKYGKKNVGLVTHSQSGHIADDMSRKNLIGGKDNVALNPAIFGFHDKKLKVVKSRLDPVSALTITNKNDKVLKASSYNPLTEHSPGMLEGRNINVKKHIKDKKHNIINMKEYDSESDSESDGGDNITEASIIKDITKLSHDIHMLFNSSKPSKKVIKGMGLLVEGLDHERISGRGQTASTVGNKNVDAFNDWSKAIGNKFKPLNKNLSPIKHAMTKATVKNIKRETGTDKSMGSKMKNLFGDGLYTSTAAAAGHGLYTSTAAAAGHGLYTSTAAAAGRGVGRPAKGSQEAKDRMAAIRAKKK